MDDQTRTKIARIIAENCGGEEAEIVSTATLNGLGFNPTYRYELAMALEDEMGLPMETITRDRKQQEWKTVEDIFETMEQLLDAVGHQE